MATIRKHRNRYQVQIRRAGFAPISRSFTLLGDAKEWARLQELQADRGELGVSKRGLEGLTLADLIRRYLAEVVPTKRHRETDTFSLTLLLRDPIAKRRLSDINDTDFSKYVGKRLRDVSPSTVKRQLNPIRHMIGHARRHWDLPLKPNLFSKITIPDADKKRLRRVSADEMAAIFAAGQRARNQFVVPIVRLAIETGMRRGEILGLRVQDVNLGRRTATIRESKNGHPRTIPLSSLAVSVLDVQLDSMSDEAKKANDRIFPVSPNGLRLAWERLTRRAGIADLHFHDLRHEAISRFFEKGLTVPEVASISGHRDIRMLLRYAHADGARLAMKLDSQPMHNVEYNDMILAA
jgi:integrase